MKRRTLKKVAKRYLDTGYMPKRYILAVEETADGFANRYTKTVMRLRSPRLQTAVYAEAYRRGWNGNHWDDPMVLSVEASQ